MAKNSFIIYHDYRETLADLTDEQVGQLFRALFDYEIDRVEPQFNGELKIAFKFIKKDLDINLTKYENICKRNKENIAKRWDTKNTSGKFGIPKNTKNTDNDNEDDNDSDNEDDNDILLSKKERKEEINNNILNNTHARESYDEIFEEFMVSVSLKDELIEFIRHCQLNKKLVTNEKLKNIIVRLDMYYGQNETEKIKSVHRAIMGGYFDIEEGRK